MKKLKELLNLIRGKEVFLIDLIAKKQYKRKFESISVIDNKLTFECDAIKYYTYLHANSKCLIGYKHKRLIIIFPNETKENVEAKVYLDLSKATYLAMTVSIDGIRYSIKDMLGAYK